MEVDALLYIVVLQYCVMRPIHVSWPLYRAWPSPTMSGFHGTFATDVACHQGTLTLPDSWFLPPLWDLLVLQLLRPHSSNLPCLYSTSHLEYPLVLSRFCFAMFLRLYFNDVFSCFPIHLYHFIIFRLFIIWIFQHLKENRESTEGYSKRIVRKSNDKFGKRIGLNKYPCLSSFVVMSSRHNDK